MNVCFTFFLGIEPRSETLGIHESEGARSHPVEDGWSELEAFIDAGRLSNPLLLIERLCCKVSILS